MRFSWLLRDSRKTFAASSASFALLIIWLSGTTAFAQQTQAQAQTGQDNQGYFNPVSLASEFFEHDFFNFYAFTDGVYDSYAPIQNGHSSNGSFGWDVGGGVNGVHTFRDATLSISYRGDYRDYHNSLFTTGTDQNLSLAYSKRLTRRLGFSLSVGAGILFYGGTFFSVEPSQTAIIPTNPFTAETKFLTSGISVSYQQTRRLSYAVSGAFFLQRYNYPGSIGTTGGSGTASVFYRITSRTTIGGNYSHSYFGYQASAGQAQVDSVAGTLSHQFHSHWSASLSGGVTRSSVAGTALVPVTLLLANGQTVGGYTQGKYNQTATFPSFSGSVSHGYRRSAFSVSAGQGIVAGNGYFLASKSQYVNGVYSYSFHRSNISAGGGFFRLSSVANNVSSTYSSGSFSVNYGVTLVRYVGANFRYDYVHYGNLNPYGGISDNRLSFGFSFSSKSIPVTLY